MFETLVDPDTGSGAEPAAGAERGAIWVGILGDVEPEELADAELVDELAALEHLTCAAGAAKARLTAALHARRVVAEEAAGVPAERRGRGVAHEVGLARRESPHLARSRVLLALALERMPHTMAAMTRGELSEHRAQIVAQETAELDPEIRAKVDALLAHRVSTLGDRELRCAVRRLVQAADVAGAEERAARAHARRRVTVRPLADGMARISADVSAADAHIAVSGLRARADLLKLAGDARTRDQITADELCDRLDVPVLAGGRHVGVQLVVNAEMLVGDDTTTPPHLVGYGPITPATASRLLADAEGEVLIRRVYADPGTNTVVAMDSTDIVFTGNLRRLLHARDGDTCRTPWCDAPPRHGDHVTPRARGGSTTLDGGQGLCEACNYAKEQPGWNHATTSTWPEQHTVDITTPTGHHHQSRAPALPVLPETPARTAPSCELYFPGSRVTLDLAA